MFVWVYIKPFLLFFLIVFFVAAFPAIGLNTLCFPLCEKGQLKYDVVNSFSYVVGMALALLLFSGFKFSNIKKNFAFKSTSMQHYPKYFFGLLGVYVLAVISVVLFTFLFSGGEGYISEKNQYAYDGIRNYYIYVVMTILILPVVEELLFRGYLQTKLIPIFRRAYVRYLMVSVFFVLMHFEYNIFILWYIFTFSMLLCWVREHSNSIYPAILLHIIFNTISVIAQKVIY